MKDILNTVIVIAIIFLGFGLIGSVMGIISKIIWYAFLAAGVYVGYKVIAGNNKRIE